MKVSVIIATKNEHDNITRLLESLRKQTFDNFEIIVVDNFSDDHTIKIAQKYTSKVFKKGPERTIQRNFGLKRASGKYILFVDADMQLEKTVVADCVKQMQHNPKLAGIIVDEIAVGKGFLAQVKALEKQLTSGQALLEAARFFRKKDIEKVGGYDQRLISGEDWDLSQRMSKFGPFGRIKSKIRHLENQSLWQDLKKKYYYAKNIKRYATKYPKLWRQYQANPTFRIQILLKRPKLILKNPIEFAGLLILKSAHYLAYTAAKVF